MYLDNTKTGYKNLDFSTNLQLYRNNIYKKEYVLYGKLLD